MYLGTAWRHIHSLIVTETSFYRFNLIALSLKLWHTTMSAPSAAKKTKNGLLFSQASCTYGGTMSRVHTWGSWEQSAVTSSDAPKLEWVCPRELLQAGAIAWALLQGVLEGKGHATCIFFLRVSYPKDSPPLATYVPRAGHCPVEPTGCEPVCQTFLPVGAKCRAGWFWLCAFFVSTNAFLSYDRTPGASLEGRHGRDWFPIGPRKFG